MKERDKAIEERFAELERLGQEMDAEDYPKTVEYNRGRNDGIEAAAEWLEGQTGYGSRNRREYAHGIRKLKK